MSTGEAPSFDSDIPATGTTTPEIQQHPLDIELIEKLLLLKETLDSHKQADAISYSFKFYGDNLECVYLPDTVHELTQQYGQIDSVEVACNYLEAAGGTSVVVVFGMYDEASNDTTFLKLDRPYNYTPHKLNSDQLYRDDPDEEALSKGVHPINERDLNRCLASLVYGNPDINIAAFDTFSWVDSNFTKLVDDLKETANDYLGEHEFIFTDSEGGPAGVFGYQDQDGVIIDIEIYRVLLQHVDISPAGNPGYYEKSVGVSVDLDDPAHPPIFREHRYVDEGRTLKAIEREDFDYYTAFDFIDQQIAASDPLPLN